MERFSSVLIELLRRVFQKVGPLVEIANLVDFRFNLGILKLLFANNLVPRAYCLSGVSGEGGVPTYQKGNMPWERGWFAKFVGYLCFIFVNISSNIVGDNLCCDI